MKKVAIVVLLVSMVLALAPIQVKAQSEGTKAVLESSFYGGLTGALIGGAFLAFRDKPSDHLKDIRVGAAAGVIIGAIYGLAKTTRAFAQLDDGQFSFNVPTIQLGVSAGGQTPEASLQFFEVPF